MGSNSIMIRLTEFIVLYPKGLCGDTNMKILVNADTEIRRAYEVKILGLTLDVKLNFKKHTEVLLKNDCLNSYQLCIDLGSLCPKTT